MEVVIYVNVEHFMTRAVTSNVEHPTGLLCRRCKETPREFLNQRLLVNHLFADHLVRTVDAWKEAQEIAEERLGIPDKIKPNSNDKCKFQFNNKRNPKIEEPKERIPFEQLPGAYVVEKPKPQSIKNDPIVEATEESVSAPNPAFDRIDVPDELPQEVIEEEVQKIIDVKKAFRTVKKHYERKKPLPKRQKKMIPKPISVHQITVNLSTQIQILEYELKRRKLIQDILHEIKEFV